MSEDDYWSSWTERIRRSHEFMRLARDSPREAVVIARNKENGKERAVGLAWVARFHPTENISIAAESAIAARAGKDAYQRSSVRAWEISALAERGNQAEASAALREAIATAREVELPSCRADALRLLALATWNMERPDRHRVCDEIVSICSGCNYWRCTRALELAHFLPESEFQGGTFFTC